MRNQVPKFNSVSIDEIWIFGDRIEFFQAQLCEIKGQSERIDNPMVNWGLNRAN